MKDREPVDIVVVPSDKNCLALLVWAREGDWAITQSAHAGLLFDDGEECWPPHLGEYRLTWLGEGKWFGMTIPFSEPLTFSECVAAAVSLLTASPAEARHRALKQIKDRKRRPGVFTVEHLREMMAE